MNGWARNRAVMACWVLTGWLWSRGAGPVPAVADDTSREPKTTPDCVFVPTPHDIVEKMLDLAKIGKHDVVYDLGCGDGRIVVQAAKKRGCRGVGFEIVPELARQARENAQRNGVDHLVTIKEEDLFTADLSEATVLPVYLLPGMLKDLKPKLRQLKPGTRIVSHDYRIAGVKPDKVITLVSKETGAEHILILYTVPWQDEEDDGEEDDDEEDDNEDDNEDDEDDEEDDEEDP